jgi:trimeric autotransporter adhesin
MRNLYLSTIIIRSLFCCCSLLLPSSGKGWAQTQLAAWTFDFTLSEPNTPNSALANLGVQAGTAAIFTNGTNGSSSWITGVLITNELQSTTGTTLNDPRITPLAGMSYNLKNNSANGKMMVIKFSMTNYQDPIVTFATKGSSTGFTNHQWAWSIDNVTYTNFGTNTAINDFLNFSLIILNMSELNDLDNAAEVYLRVTMTGATSSDGYNTFDNFVVQATPVITTTWNGYAWSNGTGPSAAVGAIIAGPYSTAANGTFTAKTLTLNTGSFTINSGTNITVQDELINNLTASEFVVENNANLVQVNHVNNTGTITVKRDSASLMRLDYTLWSSPVAGQQLFSFSPLTVVSRFYTYNPTSNFYNTVSDPHSTSFAAGTSYLIRVPNNHPQTPLIWNGTFIGTPNNGTIGVPVTSNKFNAIGNPYPSAIDADTFLIANDISGALYFWRKTNGAQTSGYATYTLAGGAGTGSHTGGPFALIPNGTIQVGQGFITKANSTTLSFTNAMKVTNNGNQFLKSTQEKSRIWLNLANTDGIFNQTMVAYMPNATQGIDTGIDGHYINDSQTALTSLIYMEEFTIQGRSLPFDDSDVVALGFKSELAGNYTIAIDHVDGLFTGNQTIYLKDHLTNTTHNLKTGSYDFSSTAGIFNSRFELVYKNQLNLKDEDFNANSVIVYKNRGAVHINAGSTIIDNVKILDIRGRLLIEKCNINAAETVIESTNLDDQLVLVQITSDSQFKVFKKVVN